MGTVLIFIVYRDCPIKTRAGEKSYIAWVKSENCRNAKAIVHVVRGKESICCIQWLKMQFV